MDVKEILRLLGRPLEFLQEDSSGRFSSTRLVVIIIVWMVMSTWSQICLETKTLLPLDWQQLAIVLGALVTKGVGKKLENGRKEDRNEKGT